MQKSAAPNEGRAGCGQPQIFEFTLIPPGDIGYSFENTGGRLGESLDADIMAVCSAPPKFAGREARIILSSSVRFEDTAFLAEQHGPLAVGRIFADKNAVEALAHVPAGPADRERSRA